MRVVAGSYGGRRLVAPRGSATRPTADRVREALFSILFDVRGHRVLDLYAGTGALGLEALSRGAAHAVFVEHARPALAALERNLRALDVPPPHAEVLAIRVDRALAELQRAGRRFDLILADPPYADAEEALPAVLARTVALLAPGGRVVVELRASSTAPEPPEGLARTSLRRYGDTALAFYGADVGLPAPQATEVEQRTAMKLSRRASAISPPATLALAQRARELAASGRDVVDLTIGEPDFRPPAHVVEAMKAALDGGRTRYTAVNGLAELREAIAAHYERRGHAYDPAEVIVSAGAKQSIYGAMLSLLEEGDEAVVVAPYWLSYVDMVKVAGAKPVIVETEERDGFVLRPERLEAALTERTRLLVLNSPSNPAGAVLGRAELAAIAEVLARYPNVVVLSDEIYDCFVYGDEPQVSILDVAPDLKPRTVVVNGCSKRYAMTGLRLGWAVGPRPLISAMGRLQGQSTSNASALSQAGALAALTGDQRFVAEMFEAFDVRRRFVVGRLGAIPGIRCFDPRGAFYVLPNVKGLFGRRLPDGSELTDAYALTAFLLHEHAVAVVPGGPFGAPDHFRISFAADMDRLAAGLDRIRAAVSSLG